MMVVYSIYNGMPSYLSTLLIDICVYMLIADGYEYKISEYIHFSIDYVSTFLNISIDYIFTLPRISTAERQIEETYKPFSLSVDMISDMLYANGVDVGCDMQRFKCGYTNPAPPISRWPTGQPSADHHIQLSDPRLDGLRSRALTSLHNQPPPNGLGQGG